MNPFEDEALLFFVVANDEGQHALWPEPVTPCPGWAVRYGPAARATCLAYLSTTWTDIRPRSLVSVAGPDRKA